jgi:D-arabinose 1-dehydrogenase-like Zn-dependent alcohol dehydrogenase
MVGIGGAIAIVVGAAVIAGAAAVIATSISADAQRDVAEINARATIQAAKEAAEAQKYSALQDATARMHESDVAFNQEMEYLKHEKDMAAQESSMENYYAQTSAEIDSIDMYYAGEGSWGLGESESGYDYGN